MEGDFLVLNTIFGYVLWPLIALTLGVFIGRFVSPARAVSHRPRIGFIGQGFIGKNYADDFESRGYPVVRFALEEPYVRNRDLLKKCPYVFIAVPTPSTPQGFDASIVQSVLAHVASGTTVVIKSTLAPGTTKRLQRMFPDLHIMHSPEFLSEATAAYDAANPVRNIVGITSEADRSRAEEVLMHMAPAPFSLICTAEEAELIKYARNCVGYMRVIFYNMLYDMAQTHGAQWEPIRRAISADPDNGPTYTQPVHKSGRGAGGHCFIKDLAAFREAYGAAFPADTEGLAVLTALEKKNKQLLTRSKKDLDLLAGVYGAL